MEICSSSSFRASPCHDAYGNYYKSFKTKQRNGHHHRATNNAPDSKPQNIISSHGTHYLPPHLHAFTGQQRHTNAGSAQKTHQPSPKVALDAQPPPPASKHVVKSASHTAFHHNLQQGGGTSSPQGRCHRHPHRAPGVWRHGRRPHCVRPHCRRPARSRR